MEAISELIWTGSYGSTTIDQICEKAGVKKGSFYYFFDSKADLAEAAIRVEWDNYRPELDSVFSPTIPPLERLRRHSEMGYREQLELKEKHGYVLGCPMCSLGAEVSTQEAKLRQLIQEIMSQMRLYLETAVRDADAAGQAKAPDAANAARIVFAYIEGLMTQARIENDLEIMKGMYAGICTIIGAKVLEPVTA